MTRKLYILSSVLTVVIAFIMFPLYLHHGFWENWDQKRANVEFFNQGSAQNSLWLEYAGKSMQVTYPESLKNVPDVINGGQGMLMAFKVGFWYRQQRIIFRAIGSGRLIINFEPQHKDFARVEGLKTGQIKFSDIFMGTHKLPLRGRFVKSVRDGEKITLTFKARKIFDFWELLCHIDWLMFIITVSLSFFISLLIVRYLIKVKLNERVSRIDIVFLIFFFLYLVLPLSNISEDMVSEQENRVFSLHPHFWTGDTLNYQYGRQFEQWFNDRFFGRETLINLYNGIQKMIGGRGNKKVLVGQQNWLYIADSSMISLYQNMNLFSENELKTVGQKMQAFVDAATKHGVKNVYFYLSPDKETLYPEFYPSYISKQGNVSRLQQLVAFLKEHYPHLRIMSFSRDLHRIKRKGVQLFCKTGSHMSGIGSYYEYLFFMREIKKDYPSLRVLNQQDVEFKEGFNCDMDLYRMLNDQSYSKRNAYNKKVIIKKPSVKVLEHRSRFNKALGTVLAYENKHVNNNLNVLFATDSFGASWTKYMAESFASVYNLVNAHGANYTFFEDEIEFLKQHKPDIIVLETTERFLQRFLNLEFPDIQ